MEINSLQNKTLSYTCICNANGDNFLPIKAFSTHLHKRIYGDSSSIKMTMIAGAASTNTVNIVNKLVTVFAPDSLTKYILRLYRDTAVAQ